MSPSGNSPDDHELDLLLSRGKMRGPAAERARERLLDALEPPRQRWNLLRIGAPLVALAAAAGIFVVARTRSPSSAGIRDKGPATGAGPFLLGLTCSNGTPAACHRGARVTVAFAEGASGYVGGYAQPEGGGERIWYFSRDDDVAATVSGNGTHLATRSVVLGPEHAAGRYSVELVVASRPLSRAEILDPGTPGVLSRTRLPLAVVEP